MINKEDEGTVEDYDGDCFIPRKIDERSSSDHGFMGTTHALSAVALFLVVTAFLPERIYQILGTNDVWVIVLALMVVAGAALIPDLDNTASTSKSSLGYLGDVLSYFFRASSGLIQTVIRFPRDDSSPNPHRGFYHTLPAAIIIGGLVWFGTNISGEGPRLPIIGETSRGMLVAIIVSWLNIHMAFAALAKKFVRKMKKQAGPFGELVAFGFSLALTVIIFTQLPPDLDYWWLGVSVGAGTFIHSFGDCFTTAGSPVIFPIPHKGKLWWNIRFLPIKAGGVVENSIFVPFFTIVIIVSFLKISGLFGLLGN